MNENPFLQEVLEHPDDDEMRLVYADYLEEQGDPRGEFIRVQCQLERTSRFSPEYEDLFERSSTLLMEHADEWAGEIKQDLKTAEFRRGFLSVITMLARRLAKNGDAIFRSVPVDWLRLNRVGGAGELLANAPVLSKIRRLDLSNLVVPSEDITLLLRSPRLTELIALNISHLQTQWDGDFGRTLTEMVATPKLQSLWMQPGEVVRPEFVAELTAGEGFPELRELCFGSNLRDAYEWLGIGRLNTPQLESLRVCGAANTELCTDIARMHLGGVRKLSLHGTRAPAAGLKAMAEAGAFDHLSELDLRNCPAGARACGVVFAENRLAECQKLSIGTTDVAKRSAQGSPLVHALARTELPKLTDLSVYGLDIGQFGVLALTPHLASLEALAAIQAQLVIDDIQSLMRGPLNSSLRSLDLSNSAIESGFETRLAQGDPVFESLLHLNLSSRAFGYTDRFAFNPAQRDDRVIPWLRVGLPMLQHLRLDWVQATNRTFDALAEADLPELRRVEVRGIRVSTKAATKVLESPSLPKLRHLHVTGIQNRSLGKLGFGDRLCLD